MQINPSLFASWFHAPATQFLALLETHAPALAESAGLNQAALSIPQQVALSATCWIVIGCLAWAAYRFLRYVRRVVEFAIRGVLHQLGLAFHAGRTSLVLRVLRTRRGRPRPASLALQSVDFSAVDIAILTETSRLRPGFTTSAPELAERLRRRPAEIEQSLEKLCRNKLLDATFGSTDGFENYVISSSGAAFTSMFRGR